MPALTTLELGRQLLDQAFLHNGNPDKMAEAIGIAAQNYADSLRAEGLIAVAAKRVGEARKTIDACSDALNRAFKRSIEPQD